MSDGRKGGDVNVQNIVQALSDVWFLVLAVLGHVVRTETRDAVLRARLDGLENQRHADMARIESMWTEVRGDIKLLLQRKD